jgi:hypothetical protein
VILEAGAILALSAQCAPAVAPATMLAIVRTESGGFVHALNVNGTKSPSRPKDQASAAMLARRYIQAGYSVDLGLAQINSRNLSRLGMTIEDALDPCRNLAGGAIILRQNFVAASNDQPPQARLRVALSMYNTGSRSRGFSNGYVDKVLANAASVAAHARVFPASVMARGFVTPAATDVTIEGRGVEGAKKAPILSVADVAASIVEAFDARITETWRPINASYGADQSYHKSGLAVDFVPRAGLHSITRSDIRAWASRANVQLIELLGPGDPNHADHWHIAFVTNANWRFPTQTAPIMLSVSAQETQISSVTPPPQWDVFAVVAWKRSNASQLTMASRQ